MKKISIIVPLYNTEKYIEKCLNSLLAQTYPNIEIIVVNDASTDSSADIVKKIAAEHKNVKLIAHTENKGLFHARITGVENSSGDYIGFLDSDDHVSEDCYRELIHKAESTDSDIVMAKIVHEDSSGYRYIHNLYHSFDAGELRGDEVINEYWRQEGRCFIWHTVWNKLYKREIWEQALPVLKKQTSHLIMTEDFVFTAVLINFAKKFTCTEYGCFYYLQHQNASTSINGGVGKFKKNLSDLIIAFDFIEKYITSGEYRAEVYEKFESWKNLYAYFWRENIDKASLTSKEKTILHDLLKSRFTVTGKAVFLPDFFYTITTAYDNRYNDIIAKIRDDNIKCVSLDIFGTAVLRPFYLPEDLFKIIDKTFTQMCPNIKLNFSELRTKCEAALRKDKLYSENPEMADITIGEIYRYMASYANINPDVLKRLMQLEVQMELKYCVPRKSIYNIYLAARSCGKKVFFTTEMYLDKKTISDILNKCGYIDCDGLLLSCEANASKRKGDIYKLLVDLSECLPQEILHIGDNLNYDVEMPRGHGINVVHYPQPVDCILYQSPGITTTHSCRSYIEPMGSMVNYEKSISFFGTRTALTIAANKLYDNPFISYEPSTEMNCDPNFFGYYALGMHLLNFTKWFTESAISKEYDTIAFIARDGYLPMKAYEIISRYYENIPNPVYLYTSRKAAIPCCISDKTDIYRLYDYIDPNSCTPFGLMKMLSPILKDSIKLDYEAVEFDSPIKGQENFQKIADMIWENIYDEKNIRFNNGVKKYFSRLIKGKTVCVDVGYSGRTQELLAILSGKSVDAFYVHKNGSECAERERRYDFSINSFYDYTPSISGAEREWLFSEYSPSCISYGLNETGEAEPVFEKSNYNYPEYYIIHCIQKSALCFVSDFCETFGDYMDIMDMRGVDASYPFEFILSTITEKDSKMFDCCRFEDDLWAGKTFTLSETWIKDAAYHKFIPAYLSNPKNADYRYFSDILALEYELFNRKGINKKNILRKGLFWVTTDIKHFFSRFKVHFQKRFSKGYHNNE